MRRIGREVLVICDRRGAEGDPKVVPDRDVSGFGRYPQCVSRLRRRQDSWKEKEGRRGYREYVEDQALIDD